MGLADPAGMTTLAHLSQMALGLLFVSLIVGMILSRFPVPVLP